MQWRIHKLIFGDSLHFSPFTFKKFLNFPFSFFPCSPLSHPEPSSFKHLPSHNPAPSISTPFFPPFLTTFYIRGYRERSTLKIMLNCKTLKVDFVGLSGAKIIFLISKVSLTGLQESLCKSQRIFQLQ